MGWLGRILRSGGSMLSSYGSIDEGALRASFLEGSGLPPAAMDATPSAVLEEQYYVQRRISQNPMWTLDRGTGWYVQERIAKKKASLLGTERCVPHRGRLLTRGCMHAGTPHSLHTTPSSSAHHQASHTHTSHMPAAAAVVAAMRASPRYCTMVWNGPASSSTSGSAVRVHSDTGLHALCRCCCCRGVACAQVTHAAAAHVLLFVISRPAAAPTLPHPAFSGRCQQQASCAAAPYSPHAVLVVIPTALLTP